MTRTAQIVLAALIATATAACGGDDSATGDLNGTVRSSAGDPIAGASIATTPLDLTASTDVDGVFVLDDLPVGVYMLEITATGYVAKTESVSIVSGETATIEIALDVPPVTTGAVAGTVRRHGPADDPTPAVAGATVTLVDAATLASSPVRDPLETLAAVSPYQATTDAAGAYRLDDVAAGRYFVHVTPPAALADVLLPGGDASRASFEVGADMTVTRDIRISQQPSPAATYLGSSTCLLCHDGGVATDVSGWSHTLHALVYRVPDAPDALQDLSLLPDHDKALAYFKDGNPRDNTGAGDALGLRITSAAFPKFPTAYSLQLGYDGHYFVQFIAPSGDVSSKYYADFTFGGHGVYKERWVTRVSTDGSYDSTAGGPSSYYILPFQYDEALPIGIEPFHPYNPANWGPPATAGGPAVRPAQEKSFDNNCAGCHFTGMTLTRDAEGNFHADAANVAVGPLDYDGDGALDDIKIGCERCHGPGSEHVAGGPAAGKRVVMPRFLAAERSIALCGQCHTRGEGEGTIAGIHTEYPSVGDGTLTFPKPGESYARFEELHADNPGVYGDDVKHSRQHHQQAIDFVKSTHSKNAYHLLGCEDCHDSHGRDVGRSLLAPADDNELCLSCHAYYTFDLGGPPSAPASWTEEEEAVAVSTHMREKADMTVGYDPLDVSHTINDPAIGGVGRCTSCHMAKTAASESRFVHENVDGANQPAGPRIRGDEGSHVFDVVTPAMSQAVFNAGGANNQMPNACGGCHNTVTGIAPNYTY